MNWNTKDLLEQCLGSIYQNAGHHSLQILVADNGSTDGSAEMVAGRFPEVCLIRNRHNLGFAGGHQQLFKLSKGEYHILVNSDVQVMPQCLDQLKDRMETDPIIGVLGCQIRFQDGSIQPSCRRFPTLLDQFFDASGLNRLFKKHRFINRYKMGGFDHRHSQTVDQVMGSFFLIRRTLMEAIGFLDTSFFMYYEEVDYCKRCWDAGFKTFFDAEAKVVHLGGGSSRKVKVATIRRTMRSLRFYFRKHKGSWTYFPLLLILSLDTATHFLHSLITGNQPLVTLKAYSLGLWDVLILKSPSR